MDRLIMRHHLKLYPVLVSFPPLSWFLSSWKHFLNKFLTLVSLAQDLLLGERNSREKKKNPVTSDMWCLAVFWSLVIYIAQKNMSRTFSELGWVRASCLPVGVTQYVLHYLLLTPKIHHFCCHLIAAAKFSQAIVDKGPENILLALGRGLCSPALTLKFKSEKSTFITITVISTL